jgi:hypothetical protein
VTLSSGDNGFGFNLDLHVVATADLEYVLAGVT